MSQEWVLPHDPELLYLREKVQRLEAELEGYRGREEYSILRSPETLAIRSILPTSYRMTILNPLAYAQANNEEHLHRYHIILRGGGASSDDDSIGYGYYASHHELYSIYDICGLMAELHKRTVHSLARFIEKKREAK